MKSCALLTPGHCASSLAIYRLKEEGYEVGPPGVVDPRHPLGHYDWMTLLTPQIEADWETYTKVIAEQEKPFAFKLQSGIIHWGAKAVDALPNPRIIVLDRQDWQSIVKRLGGDAQWVWDFSRALFRVIADLEGDGIPVEFWTKEQLCGVKP